MRVYNVNFLSALSRQDRATYVLNDGVKRLQSRDLIPYADLFPLGTGSRRGGVSECLTDLHHAFAQSKQTRPWLSKLAKYGEELTTRSYFQLWRISHPRLHLRPDILDDEVPWVFRSSGVRVWAEVRGQRRSWRRGAAGSSPGLIIHVPSQIALQSRYKY